METVAWGPGVQSARAASCTAGPLGICAAEWREAIWSEWNKIGLLCLDWRSLR